jgi:hypothetical protein
MNPFSFAMSFQEWSKSFPGLTPEAAMSKWRAEGLALHLRIKDRPSRAEAELALADFDEARPKKWSARA